MLDDKNTVVNSTFFNWIVKNRMIVTIMICLTFLSGLPVLEKKMAPVMKISLQEVKIVLDAGHGGPDGGASSQDGLLEKNISLQVVHRLRVLCEQAGANVILTRETDLDLGQGGDTIRQRKRIDLMQRVKLIRDGNPNLMISVHLNSISGGQWSGAQTFYAKVNQENKTLAEAVQSELIAGLENTKRKVKPIDHVYLLNRVKQPAILVEIGFLSNPEESRKLAVENYQNQIAESIYRGIIRYLETMQMGEREAGIVR